MANKKMNKFVLISLLSTLGLAACSSEVFAKPSDYSKPIINIANETVFNNSLEKIYDSIHEGTLASDVLNELMYQYANSMFGYYNSVTFANAKISEKATNVPTMLDAVKAIKVDENNKPTGLDASKRQAFDSFVEAYPVYGEKNDDATYKKLYAKYLTIEKRIASAMFEKLNSSSFKVDSEFIEKKFAADLHYNYNNVNFESAKTSGKMHVLTSEDSEENVFEDMLTREFYQSEFLGSTASATAAKFTFIEDSIIPDIYRDLLTEQYVLNETYMTLGRSQARKIKVIAIKNNDNYNLAARTLMYDLTQKINAKQDKALTDTQISDQFDLYSNLWKGNFDFFNGDNISKEAKILLDINSSAKYDINDMPFPVFGYEYVNVAEEGQPAVYDWQAKTDEESKTWGKEGHDPYFKNTEMGGVYDNFRKITNNEYTTDTAQESSFSGSGKYDYEHGLMLNEREIKGKNYITDGWYLQDGLGVLPSTITDRLFETSVAKALDNKDTKDRWTDGKYNSDNDPNQYVAKINGAYFLKKGNIAKADITDPVARANDILFYEESSKTYYVVQIVEAVNTGKLVDAEKSVYSAKDRATDKETFDDIVNSVGELISGSSTYQSLAKNYWLEKMDLKYHDDVIYDYFESAFPDLFED